MNVKCDDTFKYFYWLKCSTALYIFIHALRQISLLFFFFKPPLMVQNVLNRVLNWFNLEASRLPGNERSTFSDRRARGSLNRIQASPVLVSPLALRHNPWDYLLITTPGFCTFLFLLRYRILLINSLIVYVFFFIILFQNSADIAMAIWL